MEVQEFKYLADVSDNAETVTARVMGKLMDVSCGTVEHYRSDFVRDAFWLHRQLSDLVEAQEPFSLRFFYSADAWGTAIGLEPMVYEYREDVRVICRLVLHAPNRDSVRAGTYTFTTELVRRHVG
jgi:hypothetical protein